MSLAAIRKNFPATAIILVSLVVLGSMALAVQDRYTRNTGRARVV